MSRKPETKGFKRGFIPLDLKTTESQAEKADHTMAGLIGQRRKPNVSSEMAQTTSNSR